MRGNGCSRGNEDADAGESVKLTYVSVIDLRSVHANFKVKQLLLGDFTVSCEKALSLLKVDRLDVVENHFVRGHSFS
ncbi:hypothetical protein TKK_0011884 [Trichogramma kaykai]